MSGFYNNASVYVGVWVSVPGFYSNSSVYVGVWLSGFYSNTSVYACVGVEVSDSCCNEYAHVCVIDGLRLPCSAKVGVYVGLYVCITV